MKKYHKIRTLFQRDPETKFKTVSEGQWSLPVFEYLRDCKWEFTEKVDGTNIRIGLNKDGSALNIQGRTNNAQIPAHLYSAIQEMIPPEKLSKAMVLYGEGYGAKIQKGGGNYKPDGASFVLFDVMCGDWILERNNVVGIAEHIGIDCVPMVGVGTLYQMVGICANGFTSQWGEFRAEGIVARPAVEMRDRGGNRVIVKLKCRDFG